MLAVLKVEVPQTVVEDDLSLVLGTDHGYLVDQVARTVIKANRQP